MQKQNNHKLKPGKRRPRWLALQKRRFLVDLGRHEEKKKETNMVCSALELFISDKGGRQIRI